MTALEIHTNDPETALAALQGTAPMLPSSIRGRLTIPASGADGWSIDGALTDAERSALVRDWKRLDIALTAARPEEVRPYIVGVLLAFPAAGITADVAKLRVQMYEAALSGLPMWAIRTAAERFIRGEIERDNHAFAPSPPELAREAQTALRPYRTAKWEIEKALAAEPERTAEERAAMVERMRHIWPLSGGL